MRDFSKLRIGRVEKRSLEEEYLNIVEREKRREKQLSFKSGGLKSDLKKTILPDHDSLVGYKKITESCWEKNEIRELFPDRAVGRLIT